MSEQTGLNRLASPPAASNRAQAALDGLADGEAWATVNATVALMTTPRAVASSIASSPAGGPRELDLDVRGEAAEVDGLLDHPLGVAVVGRVRLERRRPLRPSCASNTGARIAAPRTPISSISAQVISTSDQRRVARRRARGPAAPSGRAPSSCTSPTITGFDVAPVAAALDGVGELGRRRRSRSSSRSASSRTIRRSGLSTAARVIGLHPPAACGAGPSPSARRGPGRA